MTQFECTIDRDDKVVIVRPTGGLDAFTARAFRSRLGSLRDDTAVIIVDLAEVDFVDAAGLGTLVGLAHRARERGALVAIAAPRRGVRGLLHSTGFGRVAVVVDSVDEAMAELNGFGEASSNHW
jgi:anti-sigma B factor antagonist